MAVILASASPRRRELMEMLGVKDMKIIPAKGEEHPPAGAGPAETVKALALAKCEEVRATAPRTMCRRGGHHRVVRRAYLRQAPLEGGGRGDALPTSR